MVPPQFTSPPSLCWEGWISVFAVGSADQKKIALTSKLQWGIFQMKKVFLWAVNHDLQQWPFNISNCCCSVTKSCLTLCDPMDCSTPGSTVLHYLLKFAQIHVHWVMLSNHFTLCLPLLLLPSILPSIRVFYSESFLGIRRPKYWSFSISNSLSNEYSELNSHIPTWLLEKP